VAVVVGESVILMDSLELDSIVGLDVNLDAGTRLRCHCTLTRTT
jgi:hypothetical protein